MEESDLCCFGRCGWLRSSTPDGNLFQVDMRLFYFADTFPTASETFVLNEIDEISSIATVVGVFSVNEPHSVAPHALASKWLPRVRYLSQGDGLLSRQALALGRMLLRRPLRAIKAMIWQAQCDSQLRWRFRRSLVLAEELLRMNVDHMHVHFACEAVESAWVVHKLTGIDFSFSTHGYDIYDHPHRYLADLAKDAKVVRSVCEYNTAALVSLGVPRRKIEVVRCGVRSEQFAPSNRGQRRIDIICVGRLHPVKGTRFLLEAAGRLATRINDLRVCIVGDGDERSKLEDYAQQLALDRIVEFKGVRSQDEIAALLDDAKLFCLPSLGDSIGVAIMEAMAMGLPVVATRVKGIPELVADGESGYLVPPADSKGLAERIEYLLQDGELRGRMGMVGRAIIQDRFDQHREVRRLLAVMKSGPTASSGPRNDDE